MSVDILKQQIKTALDQGKDAAQDLDNQVDTDALRQATADKIAEAVQSYLKTSLTSVIGGGEINYFIIILPNYFHNSK